MSETTLNYLIFCDVVKWVPVKYNFKQLLELSLLSKSVFKIIQNIVCYQCESYKIQLGGLNNFKRYITSIGTREISNGNKRIKTTQHEDTYQFKLVQYKEIEYIRICIDQDTLMQGITSFRNKNSQIRQINKELKENFKINCPNLKRVHYVVDMESNHYKELNQINQDYYDYTENGFYSFELLKIGMNRVRLPTSNQLEVDKTNQTNVSINQSYEYTFNFINNYQPSKVIIESSGSSSMQFLLKHSGYSNLVAFKCIKSLKFKDQPALSPNLIKKLLSTVNLHTLYLCNDSKHECYNGTCREKNDLLKSLCKGLSLNTTLVKFGFNQYSRNQFTCFFNDPSSLFNTIISSDNSTLKYLNISSFKFIDKQSLSPLSNIPTITSLAYIGIDNNGCYNSTELSNEISTSITSILDHILLNPNITKLKLYPGELNVTNTHQIISTFSTKYLNQHYQHHQLTIKLHITAPQKPYCNRALHLVGNPHPLLNNLLLNNNQNLRIILTP